MVDDARSLPPSPGLDEPFSNRDVAYCLVGSFFLRIASAGGAQLISLYLGTLDRAYTESGGTAGVQVAATFISLVAVSFYFTELLGSPIFGALTDRRGPRLFLLLGPLFGIIANQLVFFAALPLLILGARTFQGLSAASSIPASLSFLAAQSGPSESRRGRIMSAFEIATIVGLTFGFILGGRLWDALGRTSFLIDTAMYTAALLLFFPIRAGRRTAPAASHAGDLRVLLREARALRLVPAWIAVNAVLGVWFNHLTFQMSKADDPTQLLVGGYSGTQISTVGGLLGLMFVIGIGIWGFSIGRLRSTTVMVISLIGFAALCPLLFVLNRSVPDATALTLLVAASLVALLVMTGFTPAALVYLSAIAEEYRYERGAIMGLYSVFLGVGQFLGGSLGGFFAQWRGVEGMIVLSAIFGAVSAVAVAGLIRHEAHRPATQPP